MTVRYMFMLFKAFSARLVRGELVIVTYKKGRYIFVAAYDGPDAFFARQKILVPVTW